MALCIPPFSPMFVVLRTPILTKQTFQSMAFLPMAFIPMSFLHVSFSPVAFLAHTIINDVNQFNNPEISNLLIC